VFAGTIVVTGIGKMVVTRTGMETEMGKIGKAVEEVEEEKTPLQVELGKLAKVLALVVGVLTLGIFILGGIRGYPALQMFTTSVAVAVAAIPEGLVVTLTVILALGMQRILHQKAIVRRLLAAETLGSVSVICADKTGTLTEGKMRVVEAVVDEEQPEAKEWLIKAAILCNDMRDPLETAMMEWAEENLKFKIENLKSDYLRIDGIPFSPQTRFIATLHQTSNAKHQASSILFVSGAPEIVLEKSKFQNPKSKLEWLKRFEGYGNKGYRLVGFAFKIIENWKLKIENSDLKDLRWLGILAYEDPPRRGVKEVLEECQKAGIKVKVITGDYLPTALALLEKLKIDGRQHALTGEELEKMSEKELNRRVNDIVLFARTTPQQKLKIVKALKENGEVVAMMGDGVNDAPALKQADIGIVVSEASDVARETADMVLLDSNFATIVHAIEEGRNIFENVKKVTLYLLSCSFTEIILIGGCILLKLPLPITAAQILWINLVQDSLPAVALAFEPKEKEIMKEPPRAKETPILDVRMKKIISIFSFFTGFFLLGLVFTTFRGFLPFFFSQTMVFVSLGIISTFIVFACRSLRKSILNYNPFANKALTSSILVGLTLLLVVVYIPGLQKLLGTHPLGLKEWIFLLFLGIINLLAIEVGKWIFIKNDKIKK
jgi:Ca2+-transporting ATPase